MKLAYSIVVTTRISDVIARFFAISESCFSRIITIKTYVILYYYGDNHLLVSYADKWSSISFFFSLHNKIIGSLFTLFSTNVSLNNDDGIFTYIIEGKFFKLIFRYECTQSIVTTS